MNEETKCDFELDLRGVACPMNFVKTRLFMDKMKQGQTLTVFLDAGEPVESVTSSIGAEGQEILSSVLAGGGHYCVSIRKV